MERISFLHKMGSSYHPKHRQQENGNDQLIVIVLLRLNRIGLPINKYRGSPFFLLLFRMENKRRSETGNNEIEEKKEKNYKKIKYG